MRYRYGESVEWNYTVNGEKKQVYQWKVGKPRYIIRRSNFIGVVFLGLSTLCWERKELDRMIILDFIVKLVLSTVLVYSVVAFIDYCKSGKLKEFFEEMF